MEGSLMKWTNYWNGWQPRWFILQNGILEYYQSSQEVNQGCKGSLNLSACEIIVHPTNDTRLDLYIPTKQQFYLQTNDSQERQKWLIALGSAKASSHPVSPTELEDSFPSNNSDFKSKLQLQSKLILDKVDDLNQQVNNTNNNQTQITEAAETLQQNCDNLIHTLEECMNTVHTGSTYPPAPTSPLPVVKETPTTLIPPSPSSNILKEEMAQTIEEEAFEQRQVETFFSKMPFSFRDVQIKEDNSIPTETFLKASSSVIKIFDCLGPTLFAPVKSDMLGNIKKLEEAFLIAPDNFTTIQKMILNEKENSRNFATNALLWLKRGLEFMMSFLTEYLNGCEDLSTCASTAYYNTLRKYHGWMVRAVFNVIIKALPDKKSFMASLAPSPADNEHPEYEEQIKKDLTLYVASLSKIITILADFYDHHNLDDQTRV